MSNEHRPIWETKEWKEIREAIKKSQCEWCAGKGVLVVQQTWKFPKFIQIKNQVFSDLISELQGTDEEINFEVTDDMKEQAEKKYCPECDSGTLQVRKVKRPMYRCVNGHEFDQPKSEIDYNNKNIRNEYYHWKRSVEQKYQTKIDEKIKNTYEMLEKRYLSGKETITLCRSCAYHRKKGNIKCKNCGINFHSKRYESCYECNTIICETCNENRILKSRDQKVCDNCLMKPSDEICEICNTNNAEIGMKICGDCVLQGHWVD